MKIHKFTFILLVVGGLAWGLEVIGYPLENYLSSTLLMVVYALVGLSAVYEIITHRGYCRQCSM